MRSNLQALLALTVWWSFAATAAAAGGPEAAGAAAPGSPAAASPAAAAPALVIEKKTIDAGDVMRGEPAHFVFAIKNAGKAPLEITAKPTCGCTLAKFDKTIPPGGQGKVEAELRATGGYRGHVQKTISLTTNDPRNPKVELTIALNVLPIVEVEPGPGKVLALKPREPTVQEFRVRIRPPEPGEVTAARCSAPYAHAAVEPLPAEEGKGRAYRVRVTVDPSAPAGRANLTLTITTSSKREPTVLIPLVCEKGIVASPPSIILGSMRRGVPSSETRAVILRRPEGPFRILTTESDNPELEAREESVQDGSIHLVRIGYRGTATTVGLGRGKVRVQTDDPLQPTVEVAVLYVVTAPRTAAPGAAPAKAAGSVAAGASSQRAGP